MLLSRQVKLTIKKVYFRTPTVLKGIRNKYFPAFSIIKKIFNSKMICTYTKKIPIIFDRPGSKSAY